MYLQIDQRIWKNEKSIQIYSICITDESALPHHKMSKKIVVLEQIRIHNNAWVSR